MSVDVYEIITNRITAELEKGEIPWRKPWCSVREGAYSLSSGKRYSLLNQLLLTHGSGPYATYKQWSNLGGRIKTGEKAEMVTFWKWPEEEAKTDNETDEKELPRRPILKYYRVFHISQVDGVELVKNEKLYDSKPIDVAERVLQDYVSREGIKLDTTLTDEAYYAPCSDVIHIPRIEQYERPEEYYSTAFHEATHSTGHPTRLCREGLKTVRYGSAVYSKEELIAEIGSMAIIHTLGISTEVSDENSSAYCKGWLSALSSNRRLIASAASKAEKAVAYILQK